mmetsp:Transcript_56252/g.150300  ORF Transcript_56252/g.150300 Transcript_56252/m.150300 type:complete len:307 (+) Transcript_56252:516-1436(+)
MQLYTRLGRPAWRGQGDMQTPRRWCSLVWRVALNHSKSCSRSSKRLVHSAALDVRQLCVALRSESNLELRKTIAAPRHPTARLTWVLRFSWIQSSRLMILRRQGLRYRSRPRFAQVHPNLLRWVSVREGPCRDQGKVRTVRRTNLTLGWSCHGRGVDGKKINQMTRSCPASQICGWSGLLLPRGCGQVVRETWPMAPSSSSCPRPCSLPRLQCSAAFTLMTRVMWLKWRRCHGGHPSACHRTLARSSRQRQSGRTRQDTLRGFQLPWWRRQLRSSGAERSRLWSWRMTVHRRHHAAGVRPVHRFTA